MERIDRIDLIGKLQQQILSLQGLHKLKQNQFSPTGLDIFEQAFPQKTFPTAAVHEFISITAEDAAATSGFIAAMTNSLLQASGLCAWISSRRSIYPPSLQAFGIAPERIIFIDVAQAKNRLWAIEEALKCENLTAVIGEINELTFTESRRLQLAVERSRVTGFIHRYKPKSENTVACVSRWKIQSLPSLTNDGMPGLGFPKWQVQLEKVRNGKPNSWQIECTAGRFQHIADQVAELPEMHTPQRVSYA